MFREIGILFSGMPVAAIICLVVGLILLYIELFIPGFGIFGISGIILTIAGIVLRAVVGDGDPIAQVFLLIFFQGAMVLIFFIIMSIIAKKGWLNRTWLVQSETAVATDYSHGTENYKNLIGTQGIAVTDLRPIGKAEFAGKIYDVNTGGPYVTKGEMIRVEAVEGVKISVVRAGY
jgi:membrane-bound serine protease (ClpP class)